MRRTGVSACFLFLTLLLHYSALPALCLLEVGHYARTCPRAENIVRTEVQKRFLKDRTITPALLRMLFHDSFVRGADASILLDSTPGKEAEKAALPNLTIRGFDLIDIIKESLESVCPGVVSCADILVLAVRDGVSLAGGPGYAVPTGRLDGKISLKQDALNLPSPSFPVEQSRESFRQKGLTSDDMVALLGAHTVGVALCGFFNDRLFNFHGTGAADPTMNPVLVKKLAAVCPNPFFTESPADPAISLDQLTPVKFDTAYYTQILAGNGILQIDQEITDDPTTVGLVRNFTSPAAFFPAFVRSIIKMGNIEVLVAPNPLGEIRRKCNVTNGGGPTLTPAPASGHPAPTHHAAAPASGHPTPVRRPTPPSPGVAHPAPVRTTPSTPGVSHPPPVRRPTPPIAGSTTPAAGHPAPVRVPTPPSGGTAHPVPVQRPPPPSPAHPLPPA